MTGYVDTYGAYISSQLKSLKKKLPQQRRMGNPFVTISRQTGAYGSTISKGLCEYLQKNEKRARCSWTVFDRELIKEVVEEHRLPETVFPYLSEATVSEIQDIIEETLGLHRSRHILVHKTGKTIIHLAQLGYVILVGRGANILTARYPGGLHVRLVSPLPKRIKHIQEHYNKTESQARELITREDYNRKAYVRKYFDKDIDDPLLYDLVINIDVIQPKEAIQIIGDLLLRKFLLT